MSAPPRGHRGRLVPLRRRRLPALPARGPKTAADRLRREPHQLRPRASLGGGAGARARCRHRRAERRILVPRGRVASSGDGSGARSALGAGLPTSSAGGSGPGDWAARPGHQLCRPRWIGCGQAVGCPHGIRARVAVHRSCRMSGACPGGRSRGHDMRVGWLDPGQVLTPRSERTHPLTAADRACALGCSFAA